MIFILTRVIFPVFASAGRERKPDGIRLLCESILRRALTMSERLEAGAVCVWIERPGNVPNPFLLR